MVYPLFVIATVLYVPVWVSKLYTEGEAGVFLRCVLFRRVGLQETACTRETSEQHYSDYCFCDM